MKFKSYALPIKWCLLVLIVCWAPLSHADQRGKPVIGFLAFTPAACKNEAFLRGMQELGYREGENFIFECRHAGGKYDGLETAAAELVRVNPEIIVVYGHAANLVMHKLTHKIPIVMVSSGEPIAAGFAQTLAHPGGNMTGVTDFTIELNIKRLELLKASVPSLKHLAILMHAGLPADLAAIFLRDCEAAGKQLGFSVHVVKFSTLQELDAAYAAMRSVGVQALLVAPMREVPVETNRLVDLSHQYGLPTMHLRKSFVMAGGLMSYGVNYAALQHRTASYVDRILKGARPGDLPIEQPSRFELYINSKTAKLLNMKLPESLLLRADEVVE